MKNKWRCLSIREHWHIVDEKKTNLSPPGKWVALCDQVKWLNGSPTDMVPTCAGCWEEAIKLDPGKRDVLKKFVIRMSNRLAKLKQLGKNE